MLDRGKKKIRSRHRSNKLKNISKFSGNMEETLDTEHGKSLAALTILIIVMAFQFLSKFLEHKKKVHLHLYMSHFIQ